MYTILWINNIHIYIYASHWSWIYEWTEHLLVNHVVLPCYNVGWVWGAMIFFQLQMDKPAQVPGWFFLPSGKHTKNYGKSPCLMGKLTISTGPFSMSQTETNYQMVSFPFFINQLDHCWVKFGSSSSCGPVGCSFFPWDSHSFSTSGD